MLLGVVSVVELVSVVEHYMLTSNYQIPSHDRLLPVPPGPNMAPFADSQVDDSFGKRSRLAGNELTGYSAMEDHWIAYDYDHKMIGYDRRTGAKLDHGNGTGYSHV